MPSVLDGPVREGTFPRDRSVLADLGDSVLDAVFDHATDAEWGEWLQAPYKRAAESGNVPLSVALMRAGATGSLLHPAIRGGHLELVTELLRLGASPTARDEHGDAPIHVAAALGRSTIIKSLIAATPSVDPNEADGKGRTPLLLASAGGDAPTVELLLILKADVRARLGKTDVGFTAFDIAARAGHTAAKEILRGYGTAERADLTDGAMLRKAAKENNVLMIDYLVESGTEVDAESETGLTPLHTAALQGASEAMAALIRHGANLNALDGEGQSALHLAAVGGSTSAIDVLCAAGVDLDLRVVSRYSYDDDCCSALDCAAFEGNVDAIKALARHGANVRAVSSLGLTVMNSAAAGNHTEVIDALVAIGPCVNGECNDEGSTTPLHTAVLTGNIDAIHCLVRHEADLGKPNLLAQAPLQMAIDLKRKDAINALVASGANVNFHDGDATPLEALFRSDAPSDILEVLLKAGAFAHLPDSDGMYPIQHAAAKCDDDAERLIDLLVEAGVGVNVGAHRHRRTPLHIACSTRNGSAVAALLRHGAATDTTDSDGNSPLHLAAVADGSYSFDKKRGSWLERNAKPSVDLLLRAGADETAVNNAGHTPHDRVRLELAHRSRTSGSSKPVLELLERALVDTTWRRRALWPMCRAFPAKARLGQDADRSKMRRLHEGGTATATGSGDESEVARDEASSGDFARMAERVLGLHEEGVFRAIISFV